MLVLNAFLASAKKGFGAKIGEEFFIRLQNKWDQKLALNSPLEIVTDPVPLSKGSVPEKVP